MRILIQKIRTAQVILERADVDHDADQFHGSARIISVIFMNIF